MPNLMGCATRPRIVNLMRALVIAAVAHASAGWCLAPMRLADAAQYRHASRIATTGADAAAPASPQPHATNFSAPIDKESGDVLIPNSPAPVGGGEWAPGVDDLRDPVPENGVPADTAKAIYLSTTPTPITPV